VSHPSGFFRWLIRAIPALMVLTLATACSLAPAGTTPTPSATATNTPAPTATPSTPTLRYTIGTRNKTLHDLANVALPVSSGTNYQWTPSPGFQQLSCVSAESADSGEPAGHEVYQVFTCQLASGAATGSGTFIFSVTGTTTQEAVAQVEVDTLAGATGSGPDLTYRITTNSHFHGAAGIALAVNAGTNYQWSPTTNFQGLACASEGIAHPEGPAGHVQYQVFNCQLASGQTTGQGSFVLAEIGSTTPTETAQITLTLA
jgi:hypothetical protein